MQIAAKRQRHGRAHNTSHVYLHNFAVGHVGPYGTMYMRYAGDERVDFFLLRLLDSCIFRGSLLGFLCLPVLGDFIVLFVIVFVILLGCFLLLRLFCSLVITFCAFLLLNLTVAFFVSTFLLT